MFVATTVVSAAAVVPYFTRTVQVFGLPDARPAEMTSPETVAHLGGIRFFAGRVDREQLEIDGALVGLEGERARSKSDRGRRDDIRVRERSLRVAPDGLNLRDVVVAVSGPGDAEGDVARESGIVADRRLQRDDRLGNLRVVALRGVADDYDAIAAVAALVEGFDIAATAAAAAAEPVHASRRR